MVDQEVPAHAEANKDYADDAVVSVVSQEDKIFYLKRFYAGHDEKFPEAELKKKIFTSWKKITLEEAEKNISSWKKD